MFSLFATVWYQWVVCLPSSRCSNKCCQRSRSNGKTIKWRGRREWQSWQRSSLESNPLPGWRKMVSNKRWKLSWRMGNVFYAFIWLPNIVLWVLWYLKQVRATSLNPSQTYLLQRTCRRGSERSQSRSSLWTMKTPLLLGGRLFNSYRPLLRWASSCFTPAINFHIRLILEVKP